MAALRPPDPVPELGMVEVGIGQTGAEAVARHLLTTLSAYELASRARSQPGLTSTAGRVGERRRPVSSHLAA